MTSQRDQSLINVGDVIVCLDQLRQFVSRRAFAGCDANWHEVTRTFSDEYAFLDFSARHSEGRPRVLIEFGVQSQDGEERRVAGVFDAFWDTRNADFLRVEAIFVDGEMVDIANIYRRITPFLNLPRTVDDVVVMEEAA